MVGQSQTTVATDRHSLSEIRKLLAGGGLQPLVEELRRSKNTYNWVGIYLVEGDRLRLDAWAGEHATQHTTIPIGQGVCGYAAESGETVNVSDVNKDPRYLMCFPSTKSEIVVPIKTGTGKVLGEIDIDSDRAAAFDKGDEHYLEQLAVELARYMEATPKLQRTYG